MKKLLLSLTVVAALMTSCSSDDSTPTPTITDTTTTLSSVSSDLTLDATQKYTFSGPVLVSDGATLTIPAGTKIEAAANGTSVYIAVLPGGKIDIQGTETSPVVISSANGTAGDWGGLVIAGKAESTSKTVGEALIAEIGGIEYSADTPDAADNSGSIKNLVLRGTGAAINSESEFNGISFYAVGSGTTVENVAVISGSDDGVEMFGGSVNLTNVYLENINDDAIDWTEGWNGTIENSYIVNDVAGFSTVVEADKEDGQPTLKNLTAKSTVDGTALQFKKNSGAILENVLLEGYATNVDLKDNGTDFSLNNITLDGTAVDATTTFAGTAVDIAAWTFKDGTL